MKLSATLPRALTVLLASVGPAVATSRAVAQGCEPIRFTTPVDLGGEGQAYQRGREWQMTLAYRRLTSHEWFIGTKESSALAPGGRSPVFKIHTVVADVAYSFNDRVRARLSVPITNASFARVWPDKLLHEQHASGLGDLTLAG